MLLALAFLAHGAQSARAEGLSYRVSFEGPLDSDLKDLLISVSQLETLQDRPPGSRPGLERRVQRDLDLLSQALRSEGYYAAKIAWRIDEGDPLQVVLTIEPGTRFVIGSFVVDFPARADPEDWPRPTLTELGISIGQPARAADVVAGEAKLVVFLQNNGYPWAKAGARRVTVDLATQEMQVTLSAEPGPEGYFGDLSVKGLERLEEDYLREVIAWPEGEVYSAATLETIRRRVVGMNLFDSVSLTIPQEPLPDGSLPAVLEVIERPLRTVGVGLGYSTEYGDLSRGFTADAFWEHRNLLGEAESLRFELNISLPLKRGAAIFRKPNWLDFQQNLLLSAEMKQEDNDAFTELSFLVFGGIERPIAPNLRISTGISFEALQTDSLDSFDGGDGQFLIGALPTVLTYDNRDSIFNPTRGVLVTFGATPSAVTLDRSFFYLLTDLGASTYYAPFDDDSMVLAVRGRIASIVGAPTNELPASKRLYAGGGGSVRGYEVDSLGPRDSDGDALGGRSLFEASAEARFRFLEDYGIVLFLDAGQVYDSSFPEFTDPQFAAGVGLRYFTGFGPVRLDVAVPLNPRSGDRSFQFYVSIGQAF